MKISRKELGLYLHIPFCVKKCNYCDFLSGPSDEPTKEKYVKALITEIHSYEQIASRYLVKTIFIGGGTPSSLKGNLIGEIMKHIKEVFSICEEPEVSIEVNPGTVTEDKLVFYKEAGINRLSFGLQSADNQELKLLGRIHDYETFLDNYNLARRLGFPNINIDLMSALPGQTLEGFISTLDKVVPLDPEHISAYSLIIEEGTPFFERYEAESMDEALDREIYQRTKEILEAHGYCRYEISNYAKPGFESKHNTAYWTRKEYLGIGLGASSLMNHTRFQNEPELEAYLNYWGNTEENRIYGKTGEKAGMGTHIANLGKNIEKLTQKEEMEEFMFLGLRLCKGIHVKEFYDQFHVDIYSIHGDSIRKSIQEGLMIEENKRIYLTEKGIDLSNMVMARFLLD